LDFTALETKERTFFAEIFKFLPPSDALACGLKKVRATPSNQNLCGISSVSTPF